MENIEKIDEEIAKVKSEIEVINIHLSICNWVEIKKSLKCDLEEKTRKLSYLVDAKRLEFLTERSVASFESQGTVYDISREDIDKAMAERRPTNMGVSFLITKDECDKCWADTLKQNTYKPSNMLKHFDAMFVSLPITTVNLDRADTSRIRQMIKLYNEDMNSSIDLVSVSILDFEKIRDWIVSQIELQALVKIWSK